MAAFITPILAHPTLTRCPKTSLLERGLRQLPRLSFAKLSPLHNHPRRYIGAIVGNKKKRQTKHKPSPLLTLAVETSCDDTCVAIVEKFGNKARILFNRKITADNREYNGVHPLVAVESHATNLSMLIKESLKSLPLNIPKATSPGEKRKRLTPRLPDFVSVTRGPGIANCLTIGLNTAKGLAVAWDVPLVAVHHMQAHALTPRLLNALHGRPSSSPLSSQSPPSIPRPARAFDINTDPQNPQFPFLTLLVSGGHTQLVLSQSLTSHSILADTPDIAVGDMLDKAARAVLPESIKSSTSDVMFGAALEKFAFPDAATQDQYDYDSYTPPAKRENEIEPWTNEERGWSISAPLSGSQQMQFNFTGLGGKIREHAATLAEDDLEGRRLLARAAMKLAFEHIASRIIFVLSERKKIAIGEHYQHLRLDPNLTIYKHKMTEATSSKFTIDSLLTLVVSGGVACNRFLLHVLRKALDTRGFANVSLQVPPPAYCTDNAAMIAWAGIEMYEQGWRSPLDITPARRWSLDPEKPPSKMRHDKGKPFVGILDGGVYQNANVKQSFDEWLAEKGLTVK